jgi:N-acetylglutamate synthase-like GNAT family acetyltransferase
MSKNPAAHAPTSFVIRPTTVDDVEPLGKFIEPFVAQGRLLPRTRDELEELTEHGFAAIIGDKIVGFAALEIYSIKLAELRSLAVSSEHQGHGIGKALVNACVELAKESNVFEVIVITSSEEFFHRCGFNFTLPGEKKALFMQTRETY